MRPVPPMSANQGRFRNYVVDPGTILGIFLYQVVLGFLWR